MKTDLCVFDIQRFSLHDGPGIRTTVFLKGCPLDCLWCHNPESKSFTPQLGFIENNCVNCGKCVSICLTGSHQMDGGRHVVDFSNCTMCGQCIANCFYGALKQFGSIMQPDEILKIVILDKAFYDNSGGGLTISGGEPMAQFSGTLELLKLAKAQGLHICLDTSGCAPTKYYEQILPYVDRFLYDYKLTSDEKHRQYTCVSNMLILNNLSFLNDHGAAVHLRCPIIPGINDNDEHLNGIVQIARKYPAIIEVEVMPYHSIGQSKAQQLGYEWGLDALKTMTKDDKKQIYKRLMDLGCPCLSS
ncbi:MAG: glycyl-radical enzyme activating protein [Oscillospiraceae bacterium]|nr:glycyl-radical enzyme activating protein [Oscillospiraceae bacterium]